MISVLTTIIPYYEKYFRKMCNKYHNLVKKINKNVLFVILKMKSSELLFIHIIISNLNMLRKKLT